MQKNVKPTLPASHLSALLFHDEVPLSKDSFPHCPTIVRLLSISIVTISLKLKRAVNKSSWAESTPGGYLPVIRQPTNGWFTYVLVDEATQGMKLEWPISMVSYHIGWIAPPKLPEVRSYCNHLELSHPLQQQENAWVQVWHTKQGFSRKNFHRMCGTTQWEAYGVSLWRHYNIEEMQAIPSIGGSGKGTTLGAWLPVKKDIFYPSLPTWIRICNSLGDAGVSLTNMVSVATSFGRLLRIPQDTPDNRLRWLQLWLRGNCSGICCSGNRDSCRSQGIEATSNMECLVNLKSLLGLLVIKGWRNQDE